MTGRINIRSATILGIDVGHAEEPQDFFSEGLQGLMVRLTTTPEDISMKIEASCRKWHSGASLIKSPQNWQEPPKLQFPVIKNFNFQMPFLGSHVGFQGPHPTDLANFLKSVELVVWAAGKPASGLSPVGFGVPRGQFDETSSPPIFGLVRCFNLSDAKWDLSIVESGTGQT